MGIAIGLLVLFILAIGSALFYVKFIEKQKIERARRLMETMEKAGRCMTALDSLPSTYLMPQLRRYLVESWYNAQRAYVEACPQPSSKELAKLEQAQGAKESLSGEASKETPKAAEFNSSDQAKEVRQLLKSLHQQIKEDYAQGNINKNQALALLDEIKIIMGKLGVDFHMSLARAAERSGDLSKALTRYRSALAALRKGAARTQLAEKQKMLEEKIKAVESELHSVAQARNQASQETLQKSLNDLEDPFAPKKQIYD